MNKNNTTNTSSLDGWPIPELIEDIHFYKEDGFMVLTERFHLSRGTCCGNQCRHCPFEYCNVKN